jgi:hypothetical protein
MKVEKFIRGERIPPPQVCVGDVGKWCNQMKVEKFIQGERIPPPQVCLGNVGK